jgi:hypothetical protein
VYAVIRVQKCSYSIVPLRLEIDKHYGPRIKPRAAISDPELARIWSLGYSWGSQVSGIVLVYRTTRHPALHAVSACH